MKRYSTLFLAMALAGCSFVEDRSAEPVEIVDVTEGTRTLHMSRQSSESDAVEYTVRSGDTLGSIAKKMLGNAQRYREIAELNGIEPQAPIYVGQTLKLPSKGLILVKPKTAKPDKQQPLTKPAAQADGEMDQLLAAQKYSEAINFALQRDDLADNNALQEKLLIATQNRVRRYRQQNNIEPAQKLLESLIADQRLSSSSQQILKSNLAAINSEKDLDKARQLAEQQQFDDAYDILLKAWQLSGTKLESNALFTGTRNRVSEHYHQQALKLYRNQELDEALYYWDRILAINPSDDLALVYKDRVKALKEKLDSL